MNKISTAFLVFKTEALGELGGRFCEAFGTELPRDLPEAAAPRPLRQSVRGSPGSLLQASRKALAAPPGRLGQSPLEPPRKASGRLARKRSPPKPCAGLDS
ncbi:unnamed protein product [Amoebophrya sp. A25]|nr:unnamed protein product [Amoebophrya sp. A25]|eukprot:GSA25T00022537001.1